MKVSVVGVSELGEQERRQWRALQGSNPALASPCFSLQFTLAAAAVRKDVRVAIMEDQGQVVGFFPHQQRWGAGRPVGGHLSDHHGVVCAQRTHWDWAQLLRGCRLGYWQFDHLQAWQRPRDAQSSLRHADSPGLDLSDGFADYYRRKASAGSTMGKLARSLRKLDREVGPVRLELDSRDPALFGTVLHMKSQQCRRTASPDVFAAAWTQRMIGCIRDMNDPDFGGRLSALYAGDTLLAAHFGMRSAAVWHWWFPVYNAAYASHSPGSLLLLKVAEAAASQGHELLDLGKGDEAYKGRFADCATPLLEGMVARPSVLSTARAFKDQAAAWVRASPLTQPLRPLVRNLRSMRHAGLARLLGALPLVGDWGSAPVFLLA